MHTFEGKSCRIHHNSDMSGEVHICKDTGEELVVDAQDILDFVANYVRFEKNRNIGTNEYRKSFAVERIDLRVL